MEKGAKTCSNGIRAGAGDDGLKKDGRIVHDTGVYRQQDSIEKSSGNEWIKAGVTVSSPRVLIFYNS